MAAGKRWAKEEAVEDFRAWWRKQDSKRLGPLPPSERKPPIAIPRRELGILLAARTGHGNFANYYKRFQHKGAELKCSCGARKTPEHSFLYRKLPQRSKLRYYKGKLIDVDQLITTREGEACYAAWIKEISARVSTPTCSNC